MIIFFMLISLGFLVAGFVWWMDGACYSDKLKIYIAIVTILLAIGSLVYEIYTVDTCKQEKILIDSVQLYAGYSDNKVSGKSFLGSGTVDEVDSVYFWVKEEGYLIKNDVPMHDSKFLEDNKNILETYEVGCKPNWLYWMLSEKRYIFHVPQGAVNSMQFYN